MLSTSETIKIDFAKNTSTCTQMAWIQSPHRVSRNRQTIPSRRWSIKRIDKEKRRSWWLLTRSQTIDLWPVNWQINASQPAAERITKILRWIKKKRLILVHKCIESLWTANEMRDYRTRDRWSFLHSYRHC